MNITTVKDLISFCQRYNVIMEISPCHDRNEIRFTMRDVDHPIFCTQYINTLDLFQIQDMIHYMITSSYSEIMAARRRLHDE